MIARSTFLDRREAGQVLAERLLTYRDDDVVVLALPRGGVPVAAEVAATLDAPLDIVVVRKLGVPGHAEFAMGAIATGGVQVLDEDLVRHLGIDEDAIDEVVRRERSELERREEAYREGRDVVDIEGRVAILVDDGIATGSTMRAALAATRERRPSRLVAAVPVASNSGCRGLAELSDDVVCALTPASFRAVGEWYRDFAQVSDAEVTRLLAGARRAVGPDGDGSLPGRVDRPLRTNDRPERE